MSGEVDMLLERCIWDSGDACWEMANTYCPQLRCEIKANSSFHKVLYPASKKAVAKQQLTAKSFANVSRKHVFNIVILFGLKL